MLASAFHLTVENLQLWRGERQVLRGVTFAVESGQALHLSGANGAGKTTVLRVICGLLQPEEGRVTWNGVDTRRQRDEFSSQLAYLGHETGLKGDLTALENLRFSVGLQQPVSKTQIAAALEDLGVLDCAELPCRVLSAGQRRRVALCRVMLSAAPLWILDEPFTNLDTASSAKISAALGAHLKNGGLALIAAHQGLAVSAGTIRSLELAAC